MDKNAVIVIKLLVFEILVMENGVSATGSLNIKRVLTARVDMCNETALLSELEKCGDQFKFDMEHVNPKNWCNLTHLIWKYNYFSTCTEDKASHTGCYWPNPLVERYTILIHKHFFTNCTPDHGVLLDPPDTTIAVLILVPIFLTLGMISMVVWSSRHSDILA